MRAEPAKIVTILSLATAIATVSGLCLAISRANAQSSRPGEDAVLIATPPDASGRIGLGAAVRGVLPHELSIVRTKASERDAILIAKGLEAGIFDAPSPGSLWTYRLLHGETVLAERSVDLRAIRRLRFEGGTAKRGLFEVIDGQDSATARSIVVAAGSPIEGLLLDGAGKLVEVETGAMLESLSLETGRELTFETRPLRTSAGDPVTGMGGETARFPQPVRGADVRRVVAATVVIAGERHVLREGDSIDLTP